MNTENIHEFDVLVKCFSYEISPTYTYIYIYLCTYFFSLVYVVPPSSYIGHLTGCRYLKYHIIMRHSQLLHMYMYYIYLFILLHTVGGVLLLRSCNVQR